MISKKTIIEFQEALKEDYGKDVGYAEASRILVDTVDFLDKLAEIHYKDLNPKKMF